MKIDVITFNIRNFDDKDGHSVVERAPRVENVVKKYDADIVGFQEVTPQWLEYLTSFFSNEYEIYNVYRAHNSHESTPIMWKKNKFECLDKGILWLSETPNEESIAWDTWNCPRILTYAKLKSKENGEVFTHINTHFGFGDECQTKSAKIITDFSKNQCDNKVIITGDFNMKPDTVGYAEMTKHFSDVNAKTQKDFSVTFHGYYVGDEPSHIDYCFISNAFVPLSSKLMDEKFDGKFPSDHYGIYSVVEY